MVHIHCPCLDILPHKSYTIQETCHTEESEHIQAMTEAEARTIMQEKGWTYTERPRYKLKTKYLYARQRQGSRVIDRYICPLSRLKELTEADLVAKLVQSPAQNS